MVGRSHDTRLLENLVKSEKEHHAALLNLLALSHSSIASLSAYGSALNPSCSQAVLGVADALTSVDQALKGYATSIDDWREKLVEIRRLDGEIEVASRDREILVTRLIKVSKQKPKGPANSTTANKQSSSGTKLAIAQSELQACEIHLAEKQRELDDVIRSAVLDGLEKRCNALVDCGNVWSAKGREGLAALQGLKTSVVPNGDSHPYIHSVPPHVYSRLRGPNHSIDSSTSLAPSQSASQVGINHAASPRLSEDTYVTGSGSSPLQLQNGQARPSSTAAIPPPVRDSMMSQYRLDIPPAHSIDDHAITSGTVPGSSLAIGQEILSAPLDDERDYDLNSSSESEVDRPLQIHENPVRTATHISPPPLATSTPITSPEPKKDPPRESDPQDTIRSTATNKSRPPVSGNHLRKPPGSDKQHHGSDVSGQDDLGGSPRKRTPSFTLFGSIAGLFTHKSKSSSAGASKGSDASPPRQTKTAAEATSGWRTRTDRNMTEDMIVRTATMESSSSSEAGKGKKKKGLFTMRRNEKRGTDRDPPKSATAGPSGGFLTKRRGAMPGRREASSPGVETTAKHRLSRHSSDGALRSRSNSITRPNKPDRRSKDDTDLARYAEILSAELSHSTRPQGRLPTTPASPAPPKDAPARTPSKKIRKRAHPKHFDDGLGSAGGALLVGPAAAAHSPSSPTIASGNTGLGGIAPGGGGVSRSNTLRSATGSNVPRGPQSPVQRRSSLQHDGPSPAPRSSPTSPLAHESLSRSDSVGSRGASGVRTRAGGTSLMRIIEGSVASRNSSIRSNGTPSALMPPPLRSALRNRSPSPATIPASASAPAVSQLQPVAATPPPVPTKSPRRVSRALEQQRQSQLFNDDEADSMSISSYETGRETLDDVSETPTIQGIIAPIPHTTPIIGVSNAPQSGTRGENGGEAGKGIPSSLPVIPPAPPPDSEKRGTDLSVSTETTDSAGQPTRRKSVRMALPPSVSSTPAVTPSALEDRHRTDVSWTRTSPYGTAPRRDAEPRAPVSTNSEWRSRLSVTDVWEEEDSDEGGEYSQARRALEKATKALASAGELKKKKQAQ
ncbi:hypothetical protein FRB99_007193 [Tulasnella sp. 403]|nr:hypothetical protein FRB99_007193 [Tulasnella sp. 403]